MDISKLIDAIRSNAAPTRLRDGREVILVPDGYHVKEVAVGPVADRVIAKRQFHDGNSLAAYVNRFKTPDTILVADINSRCISVAIDYHGEAVGPVDHVATWTMLPSQEYEAWSKFEGRLHEQADFIRFMEENSLDVILPDPAKLLDLCRDFEAIKTVNFKASKRLDNGDREFTYAESTGTSDKIAVPQKLTLSMPIFYGEEAIEVVALFRYRMNDGGLKLGYEFHRIQPVIDASFRVAAARVAEAAGLSVHFGSAI